MKNYIPKNDSDELNEKYLFNMTATDLLVAIATGQIDVVLAAKKQLANRGQGKNGTWVGFDASKKEWGLKGGGNK